MGKEIRIYFESVEQGAHFVLPTIRKTLKQLKLEIPIKLVILKKLRNGKKYKEYYGGMLASILFWKEPDVLISLLDDENEYPLLFIEFSTAVFTEDHELQRFDGLVAAAENNSIYVKISPLSKKSPSDHGGKIEFDYIKPYALIYKKYGQLFFHFNWEVNQKGIVKVNKNYLSCPERIKDFEILLTNIFKVIDKCLTSNWVKRVNKQLSKNNEFKGWFDRVKNYKISGVTESNTSRTRWIDKDINFGEKFLELKLNRFGHAMDPERGMLAFFGTLVKTVSKMLFDQKNDAWYKDIPTEDRIKNYIRKKGLKRGYDFLYCFSLGSGLYNNEDFMKIVKRFESDKSRTLKINLTDFINDSFTKMNKPLRTIFKFSEAFYIEDVNGDKRVIFFWKDIKLLNSLDGVLNKTILRKLTKLDEDLITYITIHNILRPNKFKILAASYPGAQGDRVILIEPGTGRRQKRKYVDIISYLSSKNVTTLQENKGKFSPRLIQQRINEVSKYKLNKSYKEGLANFQQRFESESVGSIIKIGVGFWSNPSFRISRIKDLDFKELDYFVYITSDMKSWKIWRTGSKNIFSKNSGNVKIPLIYEVIENKNKAIKNLSKFMEIN